ncbi:MAG TPA: hypothetical protein VF811_07120 [Parasulfuritortus sp.]
MTGLDIGQVIKVGFLVSYDWSLLSNSIPLVYTEADKITLAIDKSRKTWSGAEFVIPDDFFRYISEIDVDNKIEIYEDEFYIPGLTPLECETRERNMLAQRMGLGGWHVQIDSDEYILNFSDLCGYMRANDGKKIQINGNWINLYKKVASGYLVTLLGEHGYEQFPVATNNPDYISARYTNNKLVKLPVFALHQTWARSDVEIKQKISNWGHANDFNGESYYKLWCAVDEYNYKYLINLHPIWRELWPGLEVVNTNSLANLIAIYKANVGNLVVGVRRKRFYKFFKCLRNLLAR